MRLITLIAAFHLQVRVSRISYCAPWITGTGIISVLVVCLFCYEFKLLLWKGLQLLQIKFQERISVGGHQSASHIHFSCNIDSWKDVFMSTFQHWFSSQKLFILTEPESGLFPPWTDLFGEDLKTAFVAGCWPKWPPSTPTDFASLGWKATKGGYVLQKIQTLYSQSSSS